MSHAYEKAAVRILDWLHHAERDLLNKPVITFGGEAGTCREIKLDDHHGLCFTIDQNDDPDLPCYMSTRRWYPVATIKQKG